MSASIRIKIMGGTDIGNAYYDCAALDVAAAIVYAVHGDWKHFGYWASAASISVFATLM